MASGSSRNRFCGTMYFNVLATWPNDKSNAADIYFFRPRIMQMNVVANTRGVFLPLKKADLRCLAVFLKCLLGTGLLSLPYASCGTGYILGILLMLSSAFAMWFTIYLLTELSLYYSSSSPSTPLIA